MKPPALMHAPESDPTIIFRYRDGLYAVELLSVAIVELDFFTWLAAQPSDLSAICRSLRLKRRPVDVMLTLFTAIGLLRSKKGVFHITRLASEFLIKSSPWNLAPYYAALKDRPVCRDLHTVLRTDKPANWSSSKHEKEWARAMEDETFAQRFTAAMDCRGIYLGPIVAQKLNLKKHRHLLDIAGGSGIYACCIAARHRHLQTTVFEKPPVDQVARNAIARRGFSDRVAVAAGDMFNGPFPPGCDVHLFSNVLHDWDTPRVKGLLKKSFHAMPPGGMIVIHDAHLNAAKSGPLPVAEYSVLLMHSTEGKCYSTAEMGAYLTEAGFTKPGYFPTAVNRSVITARKPK